MKSLRSLFILAALCGIVALACGDDSSDDDDPGNGNEGPPPPSLVGVWAYQSVTIDGMPADLADVLDWVPGAIGAELQIVENSAFVYQEVDATGGQLWAELGFVFVNDAGEIDVNTQRNTDGEVDEMLTFVFTVTDETLTLRQVGSTLVFTLVKQPVG